MSFYGLVEKVEFEGLIKRAKESCMQDAIKRLREFDPMNEEFFKAAMPSDTPDVLIKKRLKPNKLLRKKHEKELKRLLG